MKHLLLLLLIFVFFSCKEESRFPVVKELEGTSLSVRDSLNDATRICIDGDVAILADQGAGNTLVALFSGKECSRLVGSGEAPDEVLSVQNMGVYDHAIDIFDGMGQCVKTYAYDGVLKDRTGRIEAYTNLYLRRLSDTLFVGCTYSDSVRVAVYGKSGAVLAVNGSFPFADSYRPSFAHAFACMSDIAVHPDGKRFAMATQYADALQIFSYENGELRLTVQKEEELPKYDVQEDTFIPNSGTKWGCLSIAADDKYIYLLYSGKVQQKVENPCIGNRIHVYDWSGNAVAELITAEELTSIAVADGKLYAVQVDESADYSPEVMVYDVGKLEDL